MLLSIPCVFGERFLLARSDRLQECPLPRAVRKSDFEARTATELFKSVAEHALLDILATLFLIVADDDRQILLGAAAVVELGKLSGH